MKTSPISEAEFERMFAKLERQPFFEIDYRGYCLWSIVRFPVYLRLRRLLCDVNEIFKTKANLSTRIINKKKFYPRC